MAANFRGELPTTTLGMIRSGYEAVVNITQNITTTSLDVARSRSIMQDALDETLRSKKYA